MWGSRWGPSLARGTEADWAERNVFAPWLFSWLFSCCRPLAGLSCGLDPRTSLVAQMAPWYQVLENDFQLHGTIPATARTTVHRGLCDLEIGARARVHAVDSAAGLTVRLLEMGLVPGTEITLIKRAPFGDPLEFRIRGYHLSLRRSEARLVRIEPDR